MHAQLQKAFNPPFRRAGNDAVLVRRRKQNTAQQQQLVDRRHFEFFALGILLEIKRLPPDQLVLFPRDALFPNLIILRRLDVLAHLLGVRIAEVQTDGEAVVEGEQFVACLGRQLKAS